MKKLPEYFVVKIEENNPNAPVDSPVIFKKLFIQESLLSFIGVSATSGISP
jgi:hypothetical protein